MVAAIAAVAGLIGGLTPLVFEEPANVHAVGPRADKGIRIALLSLETAARESGLFKSKKSDWETIQEQFVAENKRDKKELAEMRQDLALMARSENADQDEVASQQLAIKTMEEAIKVKRDQQQKYLALLLEQYQKEVLQAVIIEVEKYVEKEGYDLVLQDYELKGGDESDFLARDTFSQTLMSKPVLYAPGLLKFKNNYVTDITESIVKRVKK